MEKTVYLPDHQLRELMQIHNFSHRGIGFHWENEDVIHAFVQFPEVAPSGKPLLAIFKKLGQQESLETCYEQVHVIEESLNATEPVPVPQFICVFFQQNQALAYLKKGETITEYAVAPFADTGRSAARSSARPALEGKKVVIVGLGGLGMQICKELAAAGVGHFTLFDAGRIDQSAIGYHMRGWQDFGRLKTAIAREIISSFNLSADIDTYQIDISEDMEGFEQACLHADLIVCATSENASRARVNSIALALQKQAVFTRMLRNQAGGEIFRMRTDSTTAPCFGCLLCTGRFFQEGEEGLLEMIPTSPQHELTPLSSYATQVVLAELSGASTNSTTDYSLWSNRNNPNLTTLWSLIHPNNGNPQTQQWLGLQFARFKNCPACSGQ